MNTKKSVQKIAVIILTAIMALLFFLGDVGGKAYAAVADTRIYTSVLTDLEKDKTFQISDYPANESDYGMYLKQIAESTSGELFIYIYQPAADVRKLTATNISLALAEKLSDEDSSSYIPNGEEFSEFDGNIVGGGHGGGGSGGRATSETENNRIQLYDLHLLSRQGVFAKYRVGGLILSKDTKRYYNITSIYREFDYAIDKEADKDNTINKVACKVGQLWTATETADGIKYEVKETEVVKLTSQMIGMHRYNDGFQFDGTKSLDSHYIAFTCDHEIDKLLSADIEFETRTYKSLAGSGTTYGGLVRRRVSLYGYQISGNDGGGWFGKKEEWHKMTSVNEFIKEVELSEEEREMLSDYEWILNFYNSEFVNEAGGKDVLISGLLPFGFIWTIINACTTTGELVFDVSLLRLEFQYAGKIYNLGAVSNIQTGSNTPIGEQGFNFWVWLADLLGVPEQTAKIIFGCVVAVIGLAILLPILSAIFPAFKDLLLLILKGAGTGIKYFFVGLLWVISAPFRFVIWLVRKIKGRQPKPAGNKQKSKPKARGQRKKTTVKKRKGKKK